MDEAEKLKKIESILHETGETHVVKSFMKSCPTCGLENENYKEPKAFCANGKCNAPLGSMEDAEKAGKCWNCGHTEARVVE